MSCSRTKCDNTSYRYGLCEKHWLVSPHGFIPSGPTREHVRALRAKGIGVYRIAALSGVDHTSISDIDAGVYETVRQRTHDAITAIPVPTRIVDGTTIMPSLGTARRIRALSRIGHSQSSLAARFRVNVQVINRMLTQPYVTSKWAARVSDLYEELSAVDGPSDIARKRATEKGWPPPLAWDDETIDDPAAKPQHQVRRPVSFAERYAELRDHCELTDVTVIADRLGQKTKSVKRQIARLEEIAS